MALSKKLKTILTPSQRVSSEKSVQTCQRYRIDGVGKDIIKTL
jgi:hypothetical protein